MERVYKEKEDKVKKIRYYFAQSSHRGERFIFTAWSYEHFRKSLSAHEREAKKEARRRGDRLNSFRLYPERAMTPEELAYETPEVFYDFCY